MAHRKLLSLALAVAGALALTTVSVPASLADDTQATEPAYASSSQENEGLYSVVIVQLTDDAPDLATMKERVAASVVAAVPGATTTVTRDYTHALRGFVIQAPPNSVNAIKATQGVKNAFEDRYFNLIEEQYKATGDVRRGPESDPSQAIAMDMTQAKHASPTGRGQVIEIIDNGVDTAHAAFAGSMDGVETRLSPSDIASFTFSLGEGRSGGWVSEKIPFAYDYADGDVDVAYPAPPEFAGTAYDARYAYGTHVAALAVANSAQFRGAAPDAQLIVAKVLGDKEEHVRDSVLLSALDDAMVLAPDVLTVSVDEPLTTNAEANAVYADVYAALTRKGISVNVPAGDYTSMAYGNTNYGAYPYTSDADSGALIAPALDSNTLATASVNEAEYLHYVSLGEHAIACRSVRMSRGGQGPGLDALDDGTYKVIDVGAGGTDALQKYMTDDHEDLSRTIFLEEEDGWDSLAKESLRVKDKIRIAQNIAAGPSALMIAGSYDYPSPQVEDVYEDFTLPTVTITKHDYDALLAAIEASGQGFAEVTLTRGATTWVPLELTPSTFSSWGATPDLRLKPEIAAPGGAVLSALPGNEYGRRSGTAEASAQVAGIAALVRQRIADDPMFAGMSAADKDAVVANFLMGTAHPVVDATQADGAFYSPRQVGSGLVDAVAATTSPVYPSVVGAANPSRPKADLGDGTDGWSFQVQLTNVSGTDRTYTLGGQALSENVKKDSFTTHSTNWAGKGIDMTFSTDSVTVPANSSATVTVTVTPTAEFASYANANAPKGTFVDGAVTFTSTEGQPDLTVPYMGFYGSWGDPSVFDGKWSDGTGYYYHMYGSSLRNIATEMPLGSANPFNEYADIREVGISDPALFYASRSSEHEAPTRIAPYTFMLRSVPTLTYRYLNEGGQVVRSYTRENVRASFDEHNYYGNIFAWVEEYGRQPVFDGYDEAGNELPDGPYKLVIEAETYAPSSAKQQLTWDFTLDTKAPIVSNVKLTGEGDAVALSFDVVDFAPIAAYGFSLTADGDSFLRETFEEAGDRSDDGLYHRHVDVPLSTLAEHAGKGSDLSTLSLQVWDWPKNKGVTPVSATPVSMTSLTLSQEFVSLLVGETVTLSASHTPVEANVTDVVWSSSDEAVATVSADGVVSAVGAGDATITVADPTQPSVVASATIHVNAPVPAPKAGVWKWGARGWWYRYEDGTFPSSTALVIDGSTYRFDAAGYMRTGWVFEDGQWFYHSSSGAQTTGWVRSGVHWYYLDPASGVMVTGWVQVGSTWYYLSPDSGAMATGWLKEGGYWYYLQPGSGAMATGWLKIWGTWYHFADNGQLIS